MPASKRVAKVRPPANTKRERSLCVASACRLLPRNPTILAQLPTKSPKYRRNNANWQRKQVCALSGRSRALFASRCVLMAYGTARKRLGSGSIGRDSTKGRRIPVQGSYHQCFVRVTGQPASITEIPEDFSG